jgi:hypothetical protein
MTLPAASTPVPAPTHPKNLNQVNAAIRKANLPVRAIANNRWGYYYFVTLDGHSIEDSSLMVHRAYYLPFDQWLSLAHKAASLALPDLFPISPAT